jgi:hypothetical protein
MPRSAYDQQQLPPGPWVQLGGVPSRKNRRDGPAVSGVSWVTAGAVIGACPGAGKRPAGPCPVSGDKPDAGRVHTVPGSAAVIAVPVLVECGDAGEGPTATGAVASAESGPPRVAATTPDRIARRGAGDADATHTGGVTARAALRVVVAIGAQAVVLRAAFGHPRGWQAGGVPRRHWVALLGVVGNHPTTAAGASSATAWIAIPAGACVI